MTLASRFEKVLHFNFNKEAAFLISGVVATIFATSSFDNL